MMVTKRAQNRELFVTPSGGLVLLTAMPTFGVQGTPEVITQFNAAQKRRGLLPSTIERREADLAKFVLWLGPVSILDATASDIEAFLDNRRWAAATAYAFISHLHAFYTWAVRQHLLERDPSADIDRPKLRPGLPRPIADEDLAYLVGQASVEMRAWLLLGAFQGLRCAEIAGLQRRDVAEAEGYLRIMGKGRKERIVPLHPLVATSLRLLPMPRKGHLFVRDNGTPITPTRVSQRIAEFMRSMSVDATAHQLRHWFGTRAYRECQDLLAVAGLMGHSNTAMTARYAQFSNAVAEAAVKALSLDRTEAA
jgi:integrase/recombinase XerD